MKKEVTEMIKIKKTLILCSVLLSMLILVPGVLADTAGTAIISGNPTGYLNLAVSGSPAFGDMIYGDNIIMGTSSNVTATVDTNAPWDITAIDVQTGGPLSTPGRMAEYGSGAYIASGKVLGNALGVGPDGVTYYALSGSPTNALWNGDAVANQPNYPWFKQTIAVPDTRAGFGHYYRIAVTFTATAL